MVPEIDSPSHSESWHVGYPDVTVYSVNEYMLDPTKNKTFELLEGLFGEIAEIFEDDYIHIGCDEVSFAGLNSSASIVQYMEELGLSRQGTRGFKKLIANYIERLSAIVIAKGKIPIAWQEAMDHYGDSEANPTPPSAGLPQSLVIEQWLSPVWNWANISAITGDSYASTSDPWPAGHHGFHALVTDGWYLDSSAGSVGNWEQPYAKDPLTNATCQYDAEHPLGTRV